MSSYHILRKSLSYIHAGIKKKLRIIIIIILIIKCYFLLFLAIVAKYIVILHDEMTNYGRFVIINGSKDC